MAVYVISDIHGNYDLFMELLKKIKFSGKDTLYVLGDVVDRGPHPIKVLHKLMEMPNNLSGGQQQRVAIARALASKPAIILADEPTGNLDSKTSQDVLGLIKMTSRQFHQTVVMITHNEEIAQLADRTIRIEDGKIRESRWNA